MAILKTSRFRRTSATRRRTGWEDGPNGTVAATVDSSALFGNSQQIAQDGLTLVRIRGELNCALSTITTSLDGFGRVAAGICVVSENAFAVGVTAIPTPADDIAWDGWIWYSIVSLFGPSATVSNSDGPANVRIPIDSKAMRKLRAPDVLVGVMQFQTEIGAAVITCKLNTRMLLKLP